MNPAMRLRRIPAATKTADRPVRGDGGLERLKGVAVYRIRSVHLTTVQMYGITLSSVRVRRLYAFGITTRPDGNRARRTGFIALRRHRETCVGMHFLRHSHS